MLLSPSCTGESIETNEVENPTETILKGSVVWQNVRHV